MSTANSRTATSRRATWAVLGLVGLWLAAWLGRVVYLGVARGAALPAYHDPEGYRETAELYTHHGWLRYEPTTRTIELDPKYKGTPIEELYLRSHLAGDVADFNAGERAIFSVENDQIFGLDPSRHRIALPFSESRSWTGALTYRTTRTRIAELRGGGAAIELVGPSAPLRGVENPPEIVLRSGSDDGAKGTSPGSAARAARAVRAEKVKLTGRGGAFLGTVSRIGDALLFNHRSQAAGVEISVSGDEIRQGNHARLDSGDLLKLRWRLGSRGSQYALLWSSVLGSAPPISVYRPINGRFRRIPERPDPPLSGDVLAAIDTALHRRPEDAPIPGSERFDLALTLDSKIQAEVQSRLEAYAQGLRGRTEPPFRAAVTVMDATTGELLALASYPTAEQLGSGGDGDRSRERWLRNHNFSRLPIGSVAKVPFAAAILDRAPFLADLRIRGYAAGKFTQLLGIALDPPLEDHGIGGGDGWIDFEEFIEHSSNKYGAALLTLATGVDPERAGLLPPADDGEVPDALDPEERFALGDGEYGRRPRLNLPIVANRGAEDPELARLAACGRIITLEHRDFAASLRRLFDVPVTTNHAATRWPAGDGDDLIDTRIWRPVLAQLYGGEVPRETTFRGASPERENLALNLVDDYRREYLSLVLGGGESTWTMPRIASVFSRLATGKKVEPRLVRRVLPEGEEPAGDAGQESDEIRKNLAPLGLAPATRQRLADAMTLVAGPAGTASALSPQLRALDRRLASRGEVLGFFSKTGSPDNSSYVSTSLARALDALIARRALTLDATDRIVYRDSGPVDADRTEEGRATRSLEAIQANPGDLQILRRYGVGARSVIQACDSWNDSKPEDRVQFERRGGRLVRALRRREIESVGAAYVFTIGAWDGAARRDGGAGLPKVDVVGHQPKRALTVSILIEGQGKGPTIAVPFAGELIREVLIDALDTGW